MGKAASDEKGRKASANAKAQAKAKRPQSQPPAWSTQHYEPEGALWEDLEEEEAGNLLYHISLKQTKWFSIHGRKQERH